MLESELRSVGESPVEALEDEGDPDLKMAIRKSNVASGGTPAATTRSMPSRMIAMHPLVSVSVRAGSSMAIWCTVMRCEREIGANMSMTSRSTAAACSSSPHAIAKTTAWVARPPPQ